MIGELLVVLGIAAVVLGPVFLRSRQRHGDQDAAPPVWSPATRSSTRPESLTVRQLVPALIVGGVVANVVDVVVHMLLADATFFSRSPGLFRADVSPAMLALGDFVAVAVFVWVYDRVRPSFRKGALGGATFGLYAGVLVGFPTHLFLHLLIVDFPYAVAWVWTATQVVRTVAVGAVVGAFLDRRS